MIMNSKNKMKLLKISNIMKRMEHMKTKIDKLACHTIAEITKVTDYQVHNLTP